MGGRQRLLLPLEMAGFDPVERARLSTITDEFAEVRAAAARLAAREARLLADAEAIARVAMERMPGTARDREMARRCVAAELGTAVRVNDRTVQDQMDEAHRLRELFPGTLEALAEARISRRHADAILDAGAGIAEPAVRAAFERVVLGRAETQTAPRTRAFARQLAERVNPASMAERHAAALETRGVSVREVDDGMSELVVLLPTVLARGILSRLTQQARAIQGVPDEADAGVQADAAVGSEDARSLDQVRADLLTDMLLTGAPAIDPTRDRSPGGLGAIRAQVEITIPVTTLTGTTDSGAEIDGRSPVDPTSARRLAGECPGWDRILLHPVTGVVLTVDRYRPSEEQRRLLHARDRHCRFPGCRMPAARCDIDHTHDHARGGKTEVCNLCCLCKRHHTLKHATDWTVRQLPGGTLEWTSPDGRTSLDEPPPRVVFVPDADPPPF
ncbi:DUF222 domain-containing protein [Microbacterium sp. X-17]|uniref:HNH endonuclease signature motif containing protein n=1 Tax=Microbacterium sp. X-17 TaxID=3144404 RepID=UPI0031F5116C